MPGPGVHHTGVLWIDGYGFNVFDIGVVRRRNPLPMAATILAAVNTIQGASHQDLWIGSSNCHSSHGLATHPGYGFPILTSVASAENIACILVLHAPRRYKNCLGVLRIESNVIEHIVIGRTEVSKTGPVVTAIFGLKNHACAGTQKHTVSIVGIVSQAPDIAPVRTQNSPLSGPGNRTASDN